MGYPSRIGMAPGRSSHRWAIQSSSKFDVYITVSCKDVILIFLYICSTDFVFAPSNSFDEEVKFIYLNMSQKAKLTVEGTDYVLVI